MATFDARHVWALQYRLIVRVVDEVAEPVAELGLESKELLLLDRVDESPYPADLARELRWPKPTVTFTVKRVEQKGFLRLNTGVIRPLRQGFERPSLKRDML